MAFILPALIGRELGDSHNEFGQSFGELSDSHKAHGASNTYAVDRYADLGDTHKAPSNTFAFDQVSPHKGSNSLFIDNKFRSDDSES